MRGRPERAVPPRAGAAPGRFRLARLRVDRLPQLAGQHAGVTSARRKTRSDYLIVVLQLHAGAAARLQDRRARGVLVRGNLQQRLDVLRRQRPGQRRRHPGPAERKPRPAGLDGSHAAAAGDGGVQAAAVDSIVARVARPSSSRLMPGVCVGDQCTPKHALTAGKPGRATLADCTRHSMGIQRVHPDLHLAVRPGEPAGRHSLPVGQDGRM